MLPPILLSPQQFDPSGHDKIIGALVMSAAIAFAVAVVVTFF
jgi:hypothetical protein